MSNISELFEDIEQEVEILESEFRKKDWLEVWYCLHSTVLNKQDAKKFMLEKTKEKYDKLVAEIIAATKSSNEKIEPESCREDILSLLLIKEIEKELEVLASLFKNKNRDWFEIHYCLRAIVLVKKDTKEIMEGVTKENYDKLVAEIIAAINSGKENIFSESFKEKILNLLK